MQDLTTHPVATSTTITTSTNPTNQSSPSPLHSPQQKKRQALLKIYDTLISKEHFNIQIPCLETILTILNNLLAHPEEDKYRRLRFSSHTLQKKVVHTRGGLNFLYEVGFQKKVFEFQEFLVFEPSQVVDWQETVTLARDLILERKQRLEEQRINAERRVKLLEEEEKLYRQQILQQIEDDKITRKMKALHTQKKLE
jgi:hypothetical protein